MLLFPYERLIIRTSLSDKEIIQKLEGIIEPKRFFRFGFDHKPYQGKIENHHFSARRIIHYGNSFLPQISGRVEPEISGCNIELSMSLHVFVAIFVVFWLGWVGLLTLFLAFSIFQAGQLSALPGLIYPTGMFIFGYGLTLGAFKVESVKSKAFFRELFQANQVDELGFRRLFGIDEINP